MKNNAVFYHAGCPVCADAEKMLLNALDTEKYDLEIVHLGNSQEKISKAESSGVKSVPALVLGDRVFHINFGADITALKQA